MDCRPYWHAGVVRVLYIMRPQLHPCRRLTGERQDTALACIASVVDGLRPIAIPSSLMYLRFCDAAGMHSDQCKVTSR